MSGMRVAVVGATGTVGEEVRRLLDQRDFPLDGDPLFLASERSLGRTLPWRDREVAVGVPSAEAFEGIDLAVFSAGAARSREWGPVAAAAGAVVIDNSSAWRQDPDVPLVVSEVNPHALADRPKGIVANPNCTTMVLMVAVKPLHDAFGLEAMVATTYQSASGAGTRGLRELVDQASKLVGDVDALWHRGSDAAASVPAEEFGKALAFNVLPHCGDFGDDRHTVEEWKLVNESRKILELPDLAVSPTCVRVPVAVGHSLAARLTFGREVDRDEAIDVLAGAPGLVVMDGSDADGEPLDYPTPLESAGRDEVLVGRVRRDLADPRSLNLFVAGDNLLKGAALNAVQIAELVVAGH